LVVIEITITYLNITTGRGNKILNCGSGQTSFITAGTTGKGIHLTTSSATNNLIEGNDVLFQDAKRTATISGAIGVGATSITLSSSSLAERFPVGAQIDFTANAETVIITSNNIVTRVLGITATANSHPDTDTITLKNYQDVGILEDVSSQGNFYYSNNLTGNAAPITFIASSTSLARDNLTQTTDFKGMPKLIVAASNSSLWEKSGANYVCDGTADDVQIQAAIDAVDASTADGGVVELTSGIFYTSAAITLKANVTLQGAGRYGTNIRQTDPTKPVISATTAISWVSLRDFKCTYSNVIDPDTITADALDFRITSGDTYHWHWTIERVLVDWSGQAAYALSLGNFTQFRIDTFSANHCGGGIELNPTAAAFHSGDSHFSAIYLNCVGDGGGLSERCRISFALC